MKNAVELYSDPERSAKIAGLKYLTDSIPGITRKKIKSKFIYYSPEGKVIKDKVQLKRFNDLKIPPAWKNVWISSVKNSHLQATGIDARGRKQYIYHSHWKDIRSNTKFERLIKFAEILPALRKRNKVNLRKPGMPLEKVLALITEILDRTLIRIGNEEYEKDNKTFGITTLRNRHVKFNRNEAEFNFISKSGKESCLHLRDKFLTGLVKKCKEIPGYHLFQYYDESGEKHEISSSDVNNYLNEVTGEYFTARDFRTWAGTVNAFAKLKDCTSYETEEERKKAVVECIRSVAKKLNNTVAICKKYYIHPKVLDIFSKGMLEKFIINKIPGRNSSAGLSYNEKCVVKLLKKNYMV
jgi:DNA topoisomerase I